MLILNKILKTHTLIKTSSHIYLTLGIHSYFYNSRNKILSRHEFPERVFTFKYSRFTGYAMPNFYSKFWDNTLKHVLPNNLDGFLMMKDGHKMKTFKGTS